MRIMSRMPLALRIAEPHPNPDRPGDSPVLKQDIIRPGVNEDIDDELFRSWADAHKDFVATPDNVKAGDTDGKIYEMTEDAPADEFGFEVALKRATEGDNASEAGKGSTLTDKKVTADDQRPGSADLPVAPVLAGAGGAAVKLPANDANLAQGKPAEPIKAPVKVDGAK